MKLMDRFSPTFLLSKSIVSKVLTTLLVLSGFNSSLIAQEPLGVQVPEGFEVTLYADDDLAHDIYSMTIDSFGRVVVSGAGYIKILIDTDKDGIADTTKTFVDGPKSGAQGMYFVGQDLLCAADGGLIRYKDRNADDRADGKPDLFWKIKTGGEHDLHTMRKGPDGWWYVIAGNMAGINKDYVTLETSPVKDPQAGTILRFSPDLSESEVYAHGFRNAYDFDFGATGDIFSFDSDGERDISLPWYRPTRVFHVLPGSHQGWFTRSWKRPDWFFDMPPVVGAFGRGSPTGVETYRHTQFPEEYSGALFVLDWTYGRVLALPLQQDGSTWNSQPIEFMTAVGQHGFAPTDVAVGADGSLYVSVGGRGTRGGVYRIRAKEESPLNRTLPYGSIIPISKQQKLEQCLQAPQPLSSWSRRIWEPLVADLTSEPFISAALNRNLPVDQRVRAIEILTEKFGGLDGDLISALSVDEEPLVRMRVAWAIGRADPEEPNFRELSPYLKDSDPRVVRAAMEALLGAKNSNLTEYVDVIGEQLGNKDKFVRQTASRILENVQGSIFRDMAAKGFQTGWEASIPVTAAFANKNKGVQKYPIDIALRILKSDRDEVLKLEAVRVLQLGLGDLVPNSAEIDPVFDGYASPENLKEHPEELKLVNDALASLYPTGIEKLDWELERVLAMVESGDVGLLNKLTEKINDDSHPVDDIHRMIVASRMTAPRTPEQRARIAEGLVNLEAKIAKLKLRQDSNWADRTLEMYTALVDQDPELPVSILESQGFGHPGHVQLISEFPPERFDDAIEAFSKRAHNDPDYQWNAEVIQLLAASPHEKDQQLIRSKFDDFALRNAVVVALTGEPQESDREYIYMALESAPMEIMQECITALGLLSASESGAENVAMVRALRRLGNDSEERQLRDQLVELLRRNTGLNFDYKFGQNGDPQKQIVDQWTAAIQEKFPEEYTAQAGEDGQDINDLKARLSMIDWTKGSVLAGEQLFRSRGCIQCHGGRKALGPDLSGVANRFSQEDLFTAIVFPNRDVSPRYQTTQIATKSGQVHTGLIVYESVDGLVLRDSNNQTFRIETENIEARRRRNQSLMPSGLLKDLSDREFAHLNAYMKSLGKRQTAGSE
ncbi:PVC-type heme-binding CxxCH protein [Thalassoglobus sp.]|uniref:PVC-type heme-binding CxxCH protein n=1 Tax=Thalassoglobus sp. TaxID=2795869 RepID=UPI003AA9B14D